LWLFAFIHNTSWFVLKYRNPNVESWLSICKNYQPTVCKFRNTNLPPCLTNRLYGYISIEQCNIMKLERIWRQMKYSTIIFHTTVSLRLIVVVFCYSAFFPFYRLFSKKFVQKGEEGVKMFLIRYIDVKVQLMMTPKVETAFTSSLNNFACL